MLKSRWTGLRCAGRAPRGWRWAGVWTCTSCCSLSWRSACRCCGTRSEGCPLPRQQSSRNACTMHGTRCARRRPPLPISPQAAAGWRPTISAATQPCPNNSWPPATPCSCPTLALRWAPGSWTQSAGPTRCARLPSWPPCSPTLGPTATHATSHPCPQVGIAASAAGGSAHGL